MFDAERSSVAWAMEVIAAGKDTESIDLRDGLRECIVALKNAQTLLDARIPAKQQEGAALGAVELTRGENEANDAHCGAMAWLAGCYRGKGEYDRALELYGEALEIRTRLLGREHLSTATMLQSMALCHSRKGEYARALELYGEVLEIRTESLGREHPSKVTTLHNMAKCFSSKGEYDRAMDIYGEVLKCRLRKHGPDHDLTISTKKAIEYCKCQLGNNETGACYA